MTRDPFAMKRPRPLSVAAPDDTYHRLRRGPLRHDDVPEPELRRLEDERPELVAVEGDSLLIAYPRAGRIDLLYSFTGHDAMLRDFPGLFEHLRPHARRVEAPFGYRLRLTQTASRPYAEPLLLAQAFEVGREWIELALEELPAAVVPDDIAPGYRLRPARPDDAEALVELDAAAFPSPSLTPETARDGIDRSAALRVLEDRATGRAAGFVRLRARDRATGHVSDIAVHPDVQRRGLGEAMLRWALAWFRGQGLRRATLTVSAANAPAIALYRKLGFAHSRAGVDYRRPIDEDEARQLLERRRGVRVRVRRRS